MGPGKLVGRGGATQLCFGAGAGGRALGAATQEGEKDAANVGVGELVGLGFQVRQQGGQAGGGGRRGQGGCCAADLASGSGGRVGEGTGTARPSEDFTSNRRRRRRRQRRRDGDGGEADLAGRFLGGRVNEGAPVAGPRTRRGERGGGGHFIFYLTKKKKKKMMIRGKFRFLECKDASRRKPERNSEERKRKADG